MSNKKTEIKLRISEEEKTRMKHLADTAGITLSDLIRSAVLEENQLVFLPEGGIIINRLVEIHKELIRCRNEHYLSDRSAAMLLVRLEEVSEQLYDVSEKLTDIHHQDEEEEDDDVDC